MKWRYVVWFWLAIVAAQIYIRLEQGRPMSPLGVMLSVALILGWLHLDKVRLHNGPFARTVGVLCLTIASAWLFNLAILLLGGFVAVLTVAMLAVLIASSYMFSFKTAREMREIAATATAAAAADSAQSGRQSGADNSPPA